MFRCNNWMKKNTLKRLSHPMKNSATLSEHEMWIQDIEIISFKQKMYNEIAWITLNGCNANWNVILNASQYFRKKFRITLTPHSLKVSSNPDVIITVNKSKTWVLICKEYKESKFWQRWGKLSKYIPRVFSEEDIMILHIFWLHNQWIAMTYWKR